MTDKNEMVEQLDRATKLLAAITARLGETQPFRCGKRQLELAKLAVKHLEQAAGLTSEISVASRAERGGP